MKLPRKLGCSQVLGCTLQHTPAFMEGECSPPSGRCETTSGCCVQFGAHSVRQSPINWGESSGDHPDSPGALRR